MTSRVSGLGRALSLGLSLLLLAGCQTPQGASADKAAKVPRTASEDSGLELLPEQAAYDVRHVEVALQVFPEKKTIAGTGTLTVAVLSALDWLVVDLDPRLKVSAVRLSEGEGPAAAAIFEHRGPRLWIALGRTRAAGITLKAAIDYAGAPREAVRAPWDGSFVWAKTKDGQPWIATACQGEGADLWWPCKDHPSEKPDAFTLRIRVPEPLVVAANGRLVEVVPHGDGTRTYHWHTDYPINNYGVALNIAPYETVTADYKSVAGETVPVTYWVLPENRAEGEKILPEFIAHLNFYERTLGPYPFRGEKYGVAETPHLGMEHQSIIAYGNKYKGGTHGYDWLHHHELGHEWWANLVAVADWRDFWIHEGLCTYMQALYAEEREGAMAYHHAMYDSRRRIKNEHPMVPAGTSSMVKMSDTLGNEVYMKGSWIVHMLRYLVGRDQAGEVLRRFAYPTEAAARSTDGSACRIVTSEDFIRTANTVTGRDLGWFFNFYLYQPKLPKLVAEIEVDKVVLRWETPEGYPFPMPVEVEVDGRLERIEMPGGRAELDAARYGKAKLDPNLWILKETRLMDVMPPR
ncbi:Aminopeptidase N [Lacunisphaera limnophila]|uniref:Aminopeptidase N n=1 Tax=Lacunisphaera limnophila TaxID=1838286 RepID=A0A1D8AWP9_9BACT|nr:M1 family metallopeptidase [Lacunisphaera limnophila]AOS45311.1 Aminopeptidase N [Lacunisphaera limnophila]